MKIQLKRNQLAATSDPGQLVAGEPLWFKDKLYIGSVGETAGGTTGAASGDLVFVGPDEWPMHVYTSGFTTQAGVSTSPYRTAKITISDPTVTEYKEGMIIAVRLPITGVSTAGLAIQINDLGYKAVVYQASTRATTHFPAGSVVWLTYNSTQSMGIYNDSANPTASTGTWQASASYYSDADKIGYQLRTSSTALTAVTRTRYYRLLFTSADNTQWVPANTTYDNSSTSVKPVNQSPIDPFGRIVYMTGTTNVPVGTAVAASVVWDQYAFTLGYSFNPSGVTLTLTYPAPVYIKCAPQPDGSAIIDSTTPFVQALPSTEDGKIYIYLGHAYSGTSVELVQCHPVFYHDGTAIRVWTGRVIPERFAELADIAISNAQDGQFLVYDSGSSKWKNQTVDIPDVINDLDDVTTSNEQDGQVLAYNSTASKWENRWVDGETF